jgi:hypothetical protein
MKPIHISCGALAVAFALAGCAGPSEPRTAVMGAGPACDVSISVGDDRGCVVTHVSPVLDETLPTNGMRVHGSSPMLP